MTISCVSSLRLVRRKLNFVLLWDHLRSEEDYPIHEAAAAAEDLRSFFLHLGERASSDSKRKGKSSANLILRHERTEGERNEGQTLSSHSKFFLLLLLKRIN